MLTTEQTAEQLGVTPARVRQMIIAGRLPAQRFGRSHMVLESDLQLVEGRKPGRPPTKTVSTDRAATAKAGASNGRSTSKKRASKK